MISFENVHLRYDTGISLRDLNFFIDKDEFVYLFGPTGAGKSSILKMIYMDLFPNDGQVEIFNIGSSKVKRKEIAHIRQRIGMVFQDFKLLMDRDIYSNIALPLELRGLKPNEIRSKVVRKADEFGLRSRLNHFPHELSSGEQQMVSLARAVIDSPDILLVDEPTAHLDQESAAGVTDAIWKVHDSGTCVVFATNKVELPKREPARTISLVSGEIIIDREL